MCNKDEILAEQEISAEEFDSVVGGIGQQVILEPSGNLNNDMIKEETMLIIPII